MARFDLYRLPRSFAGAAGPATMVVDVQSPHLDYLESRVVVPLRPRSQVKPAAELHPVFDLEGEPHVLVTHALAAVRRRDLGYPVGNLAGFRDEITRALDILISGF